MNQVEKEAVLEEPDELEMESDLELTDDEKIDIVAKRILEQYKPAFLELAK